MKYAAAYIRVSDDRQDEYSPDTSLNSFVSTPAKTATACRMNMCSMTMVSPGAA